MKQHLAIVRAVLRKDLRLFWPLAVATAALIVLGRMEGLVMDLGHIGAIMGAFIQVATPLAAVVLILLVIHEDAVVSANHDWLTRPIPGGALLAAKATFIVSVLMGSSIIGQAANELYRGYGIAEALLGGVVFGAMGNTWMVLIGVTSLASLTANIRQAIVLAIAATVSVIVIWYLAVSVSGMLYVNGRFGADWIVERSLMVIVIAAGAGVLWLQYSQRRVRSSWILILSTVAGFAVFLSLLSWPRGFAIQKALAPEPDAAKAVSVEGVDGCFKASRVNDQGGLFSIANLGPDSMRVWAERAFAPADIIFATTLLQREIPRDSKLVVDRVIGTFRRAGEEEETGVQLARNTPRWTESAGMLAANHYWFLSRSEYDRLAGSSGVEFRLDYSLSLLTPKTTIELIADGRRAFYPGIGYCSAKMTKGTATAEVNCLKMGAQPALLFAKPAGASDAQGRASDYPNYVPTALDFLGGKHHWMQFTLPANASRIQVTAYEAQSHFDRQFVIPGVLGGTPTACPAPG